MKSFWDEIRAELIIQNQKSYAVSYNKIEDNSLNEVNNNFVHTKTNVVLLEDISNIHCPKLEIMLFHGRF